MKIELGEKVTNNDIEFRAEIEFRVRSKNDIRFQYNAIRSENRAEFEFRASSKIEIGKKLQIMTLSFELKLNFKLGLKSIFGSNMTLSEANIKLS